MGEQEAATQTVEAQEEEEDMSELELEVATLANRFLHAAYWFLVLGVTFSRRGLEGLARAARRRQANSMEAAASLLATMERPRLADVLKPGWEVEDNADSAVRTLEQVGGSRDKETRFGLKGFRFNFFWVHPVDW